MLDLTQVQLQSLRVYHPLRGVSEGPEEVG